MTVVYPPTKEQRQPEINQLKVEVEGDVAGIVQTDF